MRLSFVRDRLRLGRAVVLGLLLAAPVVVGPAVCLAAEVTSVDMLFVVDESGSMTDEHQFL